MLGDKQPPSLGEEYVFKKLGKSLTASKPIKIGDLFTVNNLSSKIVGDGIPVRRSLSLINSVAKSNYSVGDAIKDDELDDNN